jgi:hypothetical protein
MVTLMDRSFSNKKTHDSRPNQFLDIGTHKSRTPPPCMAPNLGDPRLGQSHGRWHPPALGSVITVGAVSVGSYDERLGFLLPGDPLSSCARLGDKPYPASGIFLTM